MRMAHRPFARARLPEEERPRPPVLKILRRFWPFLRPYWGAVVIGTIAVTLTTMLGKAPPLLTRRLLDHVLVPAVKRVWTPESYALAMHETWQLLGLLLAIGAATALLSSLRLYTLHRAGEGFVMDLRVRLYEHLQRLSLSYYESRQTGDIMARVSGDVGAMQNLLTHASDTLISDVLNLVITIGIMLYLSWRLTLVALLPVPVLVVSIYFFARIIRPLYRQIRDRLGDINARLQDNLSGIRVIKGFTREGFEAQRFAQDNREYYDLSIRGIRLWTRFFPAMQFVQGLGGLSVLGYGAYLMLQPKPTVSVGDLFAFTMYVGQFYHPIGSLFRIYNTVLQAFSAGERVLEVLDEMPEVQDAPEAVDLPPLRGHVRFENVSFRYPTGDQVLSNINLEAKPGEMVALVGRSGAGKSTIINLIPRFYDPTEGRVLIDGYDLRAVTQRSLRRQIAMVLQDTFLFNGTVKENIRYGRLEATDEEIVEAAKVANAHEFIIELPEGYDTEIGERGVKLSGGQKQRLSIARAVLANPRILILDEATSMVDTESEILIQQALAELMKGRTTFVIAHRLSTIKRADKIVALENGRIVEQGRHEELLARGGAYAAMYALQQWGWEEEEGPPWRRRAALQLAEKEPFPQDIFGEREDRV
ncbi:MAG TPA: ABC transporter ATP-binding protein [Armatimonadetes bacterium]|nr:ABC transporter ATP-binding protein [Armatimonadota bacterium]